MSESSKVSVNYFCIGAFLIFMGSILFCSLGFTVVLPFQVTRKWPEVMCKVINSSFDHRFCSCEDGYSGWDEEISASFKHRQKGLKIKTPSPLTTILNPDLSNNSWLSSSSLYSSNCFNKYPCLKIYVQYVEVKPTTTITVTTTTGILTSTTTNSRSSSIYITTIFKNSIALKSHGSTKHKETKLEKYDDYVLLRNNTGENRDRNSTKIQIINEDFKETKRGKKNKDNKDDKENKKNGNKYHVNEYKKHAAQLFRSWDDSFYAQCSLIECGEDVWNTKMNSRFKNKWGIPGSSYPCYYDPNHKEVAILERLSAGVVFHAIFWPLMCFISGATLWAFLCAGCCKNEQKKCKEKNKLNN